MSRAAIGGAESLNNQKRSLPAEAEDFHFSEPLFGMNKPTRRHREPTDAEIVQTHSKKWEIFNDFRSSVAQYLQLRRQRDCRKRIHCG